MEEVIDTVGDTIEVESLQIRLEKALSVSEKLKTDAFMEREINIELSRKNEALRQQTLSLEERLKAAKLAMFAMEAAVRSICSAVGKPSLFSVY
jgi:hypothetical protein